jgi:hypothetical protein
MIVWCYQLMLSLSDNTTNLFFSHSSTSGQGVGVTYMSSSFPSTAGQYVTGSVSFDRANNIVAFHMNGQVLETSVIQGTPPGSYQASSLYNQVIAIGSRLNKGFVSNNTIIQHVVAYANMRSAQQLQMDILSKPVPNQEDGMIYLFDLSGPIAMT